MTDEKNIGQLVNRLTSWTIDEELQRIRRAVERSYKSSFTCGHIAADKETYSLIANYVGKVLNIPDSNIHELKIPSQFRGLGVYFLDRREEYPGTPESVHLVKALGFERLDTLKLNYSRAAHDFDQSVHFGGWDGPKILLITNIGFSLGEEIYNEAVLAQLIHNLKSSSGRLKNE